MNLFLGHGSARITTDRIYVCIFKSVFFCVQFPN